MMVRLDTRKQNIYSIDRYPLDVLFLPRQLLVDRPPKVGAQRRNSVGFTSRGYLFPKRRWCMSTKRSFPLNNPHQEKAISASGNKFNNPEDRRDTGRGKGVSKGGRERVKPAEAIVKCQMCGREQKIVFLVGEPPEYHKCIWCGQIQPMDGYHVVAYGLVLPWVLAPHELEQRKRELAEGRG